MKITEINGLSDIEIKQKVNDLEEELFNLRFQSRLGRLDNPIRLRLLRRDIARLKTVRHERAAESKTKENNKKTVAAK